MKSNRWLPVLAVVAALLLPLATVTGYTQFLLNIAVINGILVLGFYVIFGLTGIFSVAQVAFMGIGSYTTAILAVDYGWNPWLALAAAPVVAMLFGILLGLPTLKLKTHYLTMSTIGFAEVVRLVLINWEPVTHGTSGIRGIPPLTLGPIGLESPRLYYYLVLAMLVLVIIGVTAASGPPVSVGTCRRFGTMRLRHGPVGCRLQPIMHLRHGVSRNGEAFTVMHLAEVLDRALEGGKKE